MLRKYESILVFDPNLSEDQLKSEYKKVEGVFASLGIQQPKFNHWGRRGIAYRVNKGRFGHFVAVTFETELTDKLESLTNQYRLIESILKFQTHRISDTKRKFKGWKGLQGQAEWGSDDVGDDLDIRY